MRTDSFNSELNLSFQLYGGTGFPFGEKRSNETHLMWPYNVCGTRTIEQLTTKGEKPEQLYGQAILVRENYLYVVGGTSGKTKITKILLKSH